jgi:hypothetical protein
VLCDVLFVNLSCNFYQFTNEVKFFLSMPCRQIRGVVIKLHLFLISKMYGGEWSTSRPGHFTLGEKKQGTVWLGNPRICLDVV